MLTRKEEMYGYQLVINFKMNKMRKLTALTLMLFAMVSCLKPERPKNQVEEKGHEEPWTEVIAFTPCTFTPNEDIYADDVKIKPSSQAMTYTITTGNDGKLIKSGNVSLKKGEWYEMKINFQNKKGENINSQFLTAEQVTMHQFFFNSMVWDENKKSNVKTAKSQIDYKYADAKGVDGVRQPIGFAGVVSVNGDAEYNEFNIRIILCHVVPPATKKNDKGKYYPFNAPAARLLGVTDMDITIPVKVL